jgi:hypothetical protein
MALNDISGATARSAVRTEGWKSEARALREEFNNLARQVSYMMPGVLLSKPGLRQGTTSAVKIAVEDFTFACRGLVQSKSSAEVAFTDTTHDIAASKEAWYTVSIASGGTVTITKGADQTIGTVLLAIAPDNEVVVGYIGVVTGVTGFNANTDDFEADGSKIASIRYIDGPVVQPVNPTDDADVVTVSA